MHSLIQLLRSHLWLPFGIILLFSLLISTSPSAVQAQAFTSCATQTQIPLADCDALVALYNSTNGAGWTTRTEWLTTNTPCSWYGIMCLGGEVYMINLPNNNLTGTLSPVLPSTLAYLYLYQNNIAGSLPTLPSTIMLIDIRWNNMSGNLPALPNSLTYFELIDNAFTGPIPTFPPNLGTFNANDNAFTGTIPSLPSSLESLLLENSNLTGTIPALPSGLRQLTLRNNSLTGTLPPLPSELRYLAVDGNFLSGEIPSSIVNTSITQGGNLHLCGGGNTLFSTDPTVNAFITSLRSSWSPNHSCVAPTATNTPTDTPIVPTATSTNTPTDTPIVTTATPTDTPTDTPIVPTATPTDTPTDTPIVPTATPTDTATNTPIVPTATPTDTPTDTPIVPTATPTDTPTDTPTLVIATNTPSPTLTASATSAATATPTATGIVTITPTSAPEERFCVYPLPVGAVQGRVLIDVLAFYNPNIDSTTNIRVNAETSWWVIGASNGFYQIWISCEGQPVWLLANTMSPNFDHVWNGAALP